jgi:hypothetical protein
LQVTKVVLVAQAQPTSAGTAPFYQYTAHLKNVVRYLPLATCR